MSDKKIVESIVCQPLITVKEHESEMNHLQGKLQQEMSSYKQVYEHNKKVILEMADLISQRDTEIERLKYLLVDQENCLDLKDERINTLIKQITELKLEVEDLNNYRDREITNES